MEDRKKYFVSLDNIDIDYLPRLKKYLQGDDCDKVPLWSVLNASTSFADEICEFELFSKDDKETTPTECDVNSSMEQCHICDTHVPTAYMQKHYKGEKHRVCAAIIRNALRRATQHAECIPFAPTGSTAQPVSLTHSGGTYFCDHCSLAVNVKSKGTHEKTNEHRVSVIHDRLLNGLLITYTDKGRVVPDSRYESEVSNERDDASADEDISRDDDDVTTALPDGLEGVNHNNDVTTAPILETTFAADTSHAKNADKGNQSRDEEDSDAESIDSIDVDISNDNRAKLFSNAVTDQANTSSQEDTTTTNKQEFIEIVTVSNDTVKVPAKNYHGISYKLTGGISCLICQKTIVDIEAHILEPRHKELVSVPVANRNCIRKISALWNHCIICNKLVQSIPHHESSSPHQTKLLALDVTSKKQQRILKRFTERNYCDVCQCNIGKGKIENHLNGVRHARNLSGTTFTVDNHVLHHHFKRDADKIECFICNMVVSDDEIDAHIGSDGHDNNYKRFLVTNHISKLNNKAFYCDCCKLKFRQKVTTEIEHVQNISHKIHKSKVSTNTPKVSIPVNVNCIENFERLDIAAKHLLYLLETSNIAKRVTCKVCKHTFNSKSTQIKNHMNKQYHQFNIAALLYVNRIKNKLDGTYFCEVCRSIIDHTKEFDHINSSDHKINLKTRSSESRDFDHISKVAEAPVEKDSYNQDTNVRNAFDDVNGNDMSDVDVSLAENSTSNVDILDRHVVDNPKSNLRPKHSHLKKIKDVIVCLICNVEVRANDMDAHIESEEHNNNYKCFFVTNHLTKSKVGYNCHACNLKTSTSEIVHANKKKHKLKIHVYKAKTSAPVDVNSIQDIEFFDRKLLNFLESSDEHGQVQCKVCKVTIESHSMQIKEHLAEQYHKFNVDALLYANKVKNKHDGTYFCEVCHRTIDQTKEIDHINGNDHIINIRNIPLSWRQRGDGAPVNPPESPIRSVNINNSYNREMDDKNVPVAYREKGNDIARVAVPLAEYTTSNNHHNIDKFKRELHSQLNEIKDDIVCIICNAEVRADDIEAHNESNHNINVRNVVSSWRQIGDDMTAASEAPSEKKNWGYVRDSNDNEINMRNTLLACKESDASKVAVSLDENPSSNVCVSLENFKLRLDKLIDKIVSNVDVRADDIVSDIENNHNISVRNRGDDNNMTGAATTSENLTFSGDSNKIYESDMNVNNAPLACAETGNDIASEAKQTKTYLSYFLENTTSNVENDQNAVDNSKGDLHSNLEKFGDEIVRCADDIDSYNENNQNNYVENRDDVNNMAGAVVTTSENLTHSVNAEGTFDHEVNAHLACIEIGDDISMIPAENTTSVTLAENFSTNVPIKGGETSHASYRTDNFETTGLSEVQQDPYVNKIKKKLGGTHFCEVCRSIIDHTKEIDHINSIGHKINKASWKDTGNDIANADLTSTENYASNVNVTKTLNYIQSENKKQDIIDQRNVSLQAINDMEDFDKIIPTNSEKYFCECCSVHLVKGTVAEHVEKHYHIINLAKYMHKQKATTSKLKDNNNDNVEITNVKIINYKDFKDGEILHANSCSTTVCSAVKKDLHDENSFLSEVPSKPHEVKCHICNIVVPNTDANKKDHLNGRRHKSNYEKFLVDKTQLKTVKNCDINVKVPVAKTTKNDILKTEAFVKAQAIKNKDNLRSTEVKRDTDMKSYLSVVPSKPYEVMCLICNTVITKNDSNIKEHFKGTRHKTNYEKFLINKKQLKPVKENVPIDNNVKVPAAAKTTKKLSDSHKAEAIVKAQSIFLKYAERVLFCRCCNIEVRHTQQDVNIHLSGWKHKVKSSAILAENGLRVDRNKIYCDVCEVLLPNLDGITHIDSSKHKTKASAKASESVGADKNVTPLVAKTNAIYSDKRNISNKESTNREQKPMQDNLREVFCDVCKVRVANMPVHLNSNQHKLNVNIKVDDDIACKVCDLKVNKNDSVQHENSAPHIKKFKDILIKNKISQKWNGVLYCELCDLFFTPVTLMKHVEHENHKKLMYRMVRL